MTLAGRSIVVCRATHQAGPLLARLGELEADPVHVPLIEVAPPVDGGAELQRVLDCADDRTWCCFTSTNAVDAVAGALDGDVLTGRIAVVGRATADHVRSLGWNVDAIAEVPSAAGLGASLPGGAGDRAIAPVAELASNDLAEGLRARGFDVEVVVAYRTVTPEITTEDIERIVASDVVLVTSPSVIHRLATLLPIDALPLLVAIGPTSAAAVEAEGGSVAAVADEPSVDGLIGAAVRTLGP